jgi:hypothetical protein
MATRRRFNSLMCVPLRTASFTERVLFSWYALHLHAPLSFSSLPSLFFEGFPSHTLGITRERHCAFTKTGSSISVPSRNYRADVVNPHLSARVPSQKCPASSAASVTGSRPPCCPFARKGLPGDQHLFRVGPRVTRGDSRSRCDCPGRR